MEKSQQAACMSVQDIIKAGLVPCDHRGVRVRFITWAYVRDVRDISVDSLQVKGLRNSYITLDCVTYSKFAPATASHVSANHVAYDRWREIM
jgi:hypothetical protein